jgi:hypothetical protein
MTAISDAVVIGLVLTLVFAAVGYYLYSQIGQLSHKVGLMENILLDLKVATEQAVLAGNEPTGFSSDEDLHFHSQPAQIIPPTPPRSAPATPVHEEAVETEGVSSSEPVRELFVEPRARHEQSSGPIQVERLSASPNSPSNTEAPSVSVNYEAMTYKELIAIARQKNIHGLRSMTKAQVIEALRGGAGGVEVKKDGPASLSNWTSSGTVSFNDELGSAEDQIQGGGILSLDDTSPPEVNLVGSD